MKNMKRAVRRHHYARLKNKRYDMLKSWYWWDDVPEDHVHKMSAVMANTPKLQSSCLCCGNPRKHLKELTLQEQRNLIDFEESMGSWRELD